MSSATPSSDMNSYTTTFRAAVTICPFFAGSSSVPGCLDTCKKQVSSQHRGSADSLPCNTEPSRRPCTAHLYCGLPSGPECGRTACGRTPSRAPGIGSVAGSVGSCQSAPCRGQPVAVSGTAGDPTDPTDRQGGQIPMTGLLVAAAILGVIGLLGYVWSHRTGTVARAIGAAGAEYNELYGSGPSTADPAACRSEVGQQAPRCAATGPRTSRTHWSTWTRVGTASARVRREGVTDGFPASQAVDHAKPMRWLGKRADLQIR